MRSLASSEIDGHGSLWKSRCPRSTASKMPCSVSEGERGEVEGGEGEGEGKSGEEGEGVQGVCQCVEDLEGWLTGPKAQTLL